MLSLRSAPNPAHGAASKKIANPEQGPAKTAVFVHAAWRSPQPEARSTKHEARGSGLRAWNEVRKAQPVPLEWLAQQIRPAAAVAGVVPFSGIGRARRVSAWGAMGPIPMAGFAQGRGQGRFWRGILVAQAPQAIWLCSKPGQRSHWPGVGQCGRPCPKSAGGRRAGALQGCLLSPRGAAAFICCGTCRWRGGAGRWLAGGRGCGRRGRG